MTLNFDVHLSPIPLCPFSSEIDLPRHIGVTQLVLIAEKVIVGN